MIKSAEFNRVAKTYNLPSYVVEFDLVNINSNGLPSQAFADPINRKWPCHTKAACYMSNLKFWESEVLNPDGSPEVGKELLKRADMWKITSDLKSEVLTKVAKTHVINSVSDLNDSDFALIEHDGSEKVRLYPVIDEETTKLAAHQFYDNRHLMPINWRMQIATKLHEKFAEYSIDSIDDQVLDYVAKAAGKGITTPSGLGSIFTKRAELLRAHKRGDLANQMDKIAATISKQKMTKELCQKCAAALDKIDTESSLYKDYARGLPLPEEDCHSILYKDAAAFISQFVKLANGSVYSYSDVTKMTNKLINLAIIDNALVKVAGMLDDTKLKLALGGLSRNQADMVDKLAETMQISRSELPFDIEVFN